MAQGSFPHVQQAEQYATLVVSGVIVANKWVRLACKRHLKDKERKRFKYEFDPARAEKACKFIELTPHTKGEWAKPSKQNPMGNLLKLEPWQKFIVCCIFGWVNKKTKHRRFRTAFLKIARKNGKSALAAAIGLYMFCHDDEYGAEIYSGATSEKQAWEVFRPAKMICERSEKLRQRYGVGIAAKNLHILRNGSRFEPVIGKPGDGASPHCAIIDEYHEHDTDEMYNTMETGMGARQQPLILVVTTAGDNSAGPCYAMEKDCQKILDKVMSKDDVFCIMYQADEGDDWTSEDALIKANPNLGISVSEAFLKSQLHAAKQSPRKQNAYKTKHLNLWVSSRNGWLNMLQWQKCYNKKLDIEKFRGMDCYVAFDLASKIDIAARLQVFLEMRKGERHYSIFGKYYIPESALEERRNEHYERWALEGWLTVTDGDEIDYLTIEEDMVGYEGEGGLAREHNVLETIFDPWQATQMMQTFRSEGLETVEVPANTKFLSPPMREIEAAVAAGRIHHNGDPVLAWMMSNVVCKEDPRGNIFPRKDRPENKIDGAVALIMAMNRAACVEAPEPSVYEERGILVL